MYICMYGTINTLLTDSLLQIVYYTLGIVNKSKQTNKQKSTLRMYEYQLRTADESMVSVFEDVVPERHNFSRPKLCAF